MSDQTSERKHPSPAEREARKAFKEVEEKKARTEHDEAWDTLNENRERLKAERLAREAELELKAKVK